MALAALCFAWGAFALWPSQRAVSGQDLRLVVLDASASVSRVRNGWAGSSSALLREQARAAQVANQELVVITASPRAQRRWGPGPPSEFLRQELEGQLRLLQWAPVLGEDLVTDWTGTLQLLGGYANPENTGSCQIVLYTDGQAGDSRAWQGLARLAAQGCVLQWGALPPPVHTDVALVGMDLPAEAPPGVPGSVRVRLAWRGASPAGDTLWPWRVTVRNAAGILSEVRGEWLARGSTTDGDWTTCTQNWPLPALESGVYQVRVDVEGVAGDRALENQGRAALLRIGEPLQVLFVGSGGPGLDATLMAGGLSVAGLVCQSVDVQELPQWLPEAHCLVSLGLSPSELPSEALADFVARGGCWLAMGEESMLAGWSGRSVLDGPDLGGLLPLTLHQGDGPGKDVILLVDGSGSMQGDPWTQVQAATLTLLRNISRSVGFEVDLFTHDLLKAELRLPALVDGTSGDSSQDIEVALRAFLQARVPGGKTNIMRSLQSLLVRRAGQGPCKVVLITDGWQNDGGSWDPASLRAQLLEAQMELSIVATSEHPNLSDLSLLLPRERILLADDLDGLAELLKQELMGDVVRRDPGMRVLASPSGSGEPWGIPDLLGPASAPVRSLVKTKLRKGAHVLLASGRSEPILGLVPRGRGLVAQLTSLEGAEFLWSGAVSLRGLVQALAQYGFASQGGGPEIVEFEGRFLLVGATEFQDSSGQVSLEIATADSSAWRPVPLALGLGNQGLDPRDWLGLDLQSMGLGTQDLLGARLRLLRTGDKPLMLALPSGAPPELLPGGHLWPRTLPECVLAGEAQGIGVHPSGPLALVLGMFSLVASLWFQAQRGKGFAESADRN
ncbi:MAG: hypothetical protein ACI9X4_000512 [Glaciecola sp.]|jgi:hypothetical protein